MARWAYAGAVLLAVALLWWQGRTSTEALLASNASIERAIRGADLPGKVEIVMPSMKSETWCYTKNGVKFQRTTTATQGTSESYSAFLNRFEEELEAEKDKVTGNGGTLVDC